MSDKLVHVVAGVIEKGDRVLIAQRKAGSKMAFKWEFPGGKVERGESPVQSLERELFEEFEIQADIGTLIGESIFDYGDVSIKLTAYKVSSFAGDFKLKDHEQIKWADPGDLSTYDLTDADIPIAALLAAMYK